MALDYYECQEVLQLHVILRFVAISIVKQKSGRGNTPS